MVKSRRKVEFSTARAERLKREAEKKGADAKDKAVKNYSFRKNVDKVYSKGVSGVKGVSTSVDAGTSRFKAKPTRKQVKKSGSSGAKRFASKQFKGGLDF